MEKPENALEFSAHIELSDNKLWGAHFHVPDPIAQVFLGMGDKRVVVRINGILEYQCALVSMGDAYYVVTVNKKNRDALKLKAGSPVQVLIWKDESTYGLPMPESFAELLAQDEQGNAWFHALTPGKQRNILYYINQAKTIDKQIDRGLLMLEHLRKMNGKIDFKILNADIKAANRNV
ncbi:MAG: DUF1905 domain-containing protein [Bacteroidetes bacterium]|nr:DUF1905 domain-containing protein [Bacteroidota bacterium]